jgi:oxygen-dependent protoporphyrinogen oxidase
MSKVAAVVGGGITGLVAGRELQRAGMDVVLLEAAPEPGGVIATRAIEGVAVEGGPDSFLVRDPAALDVCRSVGLGNELVRPAVFAGTVWSRGRLHPLPRGLVFGVPTLPVRLLRAGLLSRRGAVRALGDVFHSKPLTGGDVSIGSLVRHRLGDEVLERLVDPLLAGTRAGDADEMSLAAAAPDLDVIARRHRSLILGARAWKPKGHDSPVFMAPVGGMTRLVQALKTELRDADVRLGTPVERVARDAGRLRLETPAGDVSADAVVLCAPAYATARQVASLDAGASDALASIPYASVAVVALVYPSSAGTPPTEGSGMLVPRRENRTVAACTWYSTKWPASTPSGGFLLRAVVGRSGRDPNLDRDDDDLVAAVHEDLTAMLGLKEPPRSQLVTRWERALPQYTVGHLNRVVGAEFALTRHGPLFLAGAGYRGAGIPDCIRQAGEAATAAVGALA